MLDEIDYRIMREIRTNARIKNSELAERVGLSPSPCWTRLRNLEKTGIIDRYVTIFNEDALGLPDTVIIEVTLERHDDEVLKNFGDALAKLPEVTEAYLVTGEYDYFIKASVRGTSGYETFLRKGLYKIPGIRHSRSSFALRCLKRTYSALPR